MDLVSQQYVKLEQQGTKRKRKRSPTAADTPGGKMSRTESTAGTKSNSGA